MYWESTSVTTTSATEMPSSAADTSTMARATFRCVRVKCTERFKPRCDMRTPSGSRPPDATSTTTPTAAAVGADSALACAPHSESVRVAYWYWNLNW